MTVPYIDALLVRQADKSFRSEAVKLPSSRLGDVFRLTGERLDFREADGGVLAECDDKQIVGRVELTDSLVAASAEKVQADPMLDQLTEATDRAALERYGLRVLDDVFQAMDGLIRRQGRGHGRSLLESAVC